MDVSMFMNDYNTSLMIVVFSKSLIFVVTVCHKCTNTYEGSFICPIYFIPFVFFWAKHANGPTSSVLAMICAICGTRAFEVAVSRIQTSFMQRPMVAGTGV
jgi:hypothetical protein